MKILLLLLFVAPVIFCNAQKPYWQQQVNYKLTVQLNDADHTLNGFAKMEYINNSPDTLHFIWFHLWPNAYRTDKTAFSDQLLENGRTDFYFSSKEDRGYINRLDFRVNNVAARTEDHPQHIDIIKVLLSQPLLPGHRIELTTPFHVKLPKNFSRGGHTDQSYQVTQWYPKPAVYDRNGWHPQPYLDQGEFYTEFGNYEVQITVPESYVVHSSAPPEDTEKKWLTGRKPPAVPVKTKTANGAPYPKKINPAPVAESTKTLIYRQNNIHDFAWFADRRFITLHDTLQLPSGRIIDVYTAYLPGSEKIWKNSTRMLKTAVLHRSKLVGEYPYSHITAVEAKMGFEGGMEYPCITAITPTASEKDLESVLEHEAGHNWFQGILASDELRHPWMDEGINSYYGNRFKKEASNYHLPTTSANKRFDITEELFLTAVEQIKKDQPLSTPSDSLSEFNYFLVAYTKGAAFMQLLEQTLGRERFDAAMQQYFQQWKFKHPQPADLKKSLEESSGVQLDSQFSLLYRKGPLVAPARKQLKPSLFFGTNTHTSNTFILSPAFGYNKYDGFMAGGAVTNYTLAPTRFQFLVAPLYGTTSRQLNGAARLSYTWYTDRKIQRIQASVSGMKFTTGDFTDTAGNVYRTGFRKLVPSVKLVLQEANPRSTRERFIQWKTFFIQEDQLRFRRDTFPNGDYYTEIKKQATSRYLNQLRFVVQDTRALYPYQAELLAEQAKEFVRLAFTGNYYFNYNDHSGAHVRFFAGKFIYLNGRSIINRFRTDAYHLNMSGPKGYEDYTYSNYFAGRSEFEGTASQQLMIRDGGFKVSTDLLASKIGKTDDWLMALNFSSDIPEQINILNILPVKIPLKAYLDIGTYAEAWKTGAEGSRLLYDAGLQVSLLKNTVNIYFPLFYSQVYRDYFLSTFPEKRFRRTISFSIDIQNFNLRKIDRRLIF